MRLLQFHTAEVSSDRLAVEARADPSTQVFTAAMQVFTAAQLISGDKTLARPLLFIEGGTIVEIATRGSREVPAGARLCDLGAGSISPGYIDLHIHGSAGHDVMESEPDTLAAIERFLVRHGVTSYYPTTVTAPIETILRALERLAIAIESKQNSASFPGRACPLGIHLEGPFLSHARRGVHPPEHLLSPALGIFQRLWSAARGTIRMMTIAPELDRAEEVIAEAIRCGVCVSLGHSDADLATSLRGIAAGARHATHTFNAMRPLDHRSPGILGAVLSDERVSADMIVDGVHLDPAIVRLVANAKGADRTVLITDATAATGMPDGRYQLGSFEVEMHGGKCTREGKLAGSVLTMDRAVRNLAEFAGWDLSKAATAASRNPARVAGLRNKGNLATGADADFVLLNERGEILRTFVGGTEA